MTPERLALKSATREMIRGVGGVEAAAGFCRVGKSTLSDAQNPSKDECFVALDVLADLEPLARERSGWPHVTRALAAVNGFALVKLPDALPEAGDLLQLIARLAKENGEIAHSICTAIADGKFERAEARDARREVADALNLLVALDAALAAIETEGK